MDSLHEDGVDWLAAISALFDGEEPPMPVADIMAHLSRCDTCSAWLDHTTIVNAGLRALPVIQPELGDRVVDQVDVCLCACRSGGACRCTNCRCGPHCTCHQHAGSVVG